MFLSALPALYLMMVFECLRVIKTYVTNVFVVL